MGEHRPHAMQDFAAVGPTLGQQEGAMGSIMLLHNLRIQATSCQTAFMLLIAFGAARRQPRNALHT